MWYFVKPPQKFGCVAKGRPFSAYADTCQRTCEGCYNWSQLAGRIQDQCKNVRNSRWNTSISTLIILSLSLPFQHLGILNTIHLPRVRSQQVTESWNHHSLHKVLSLDANTLLAFFGGGSWHSVLSQGCYCCHWPHVVILTHGVISLNRSWYRQVSSLPVSAHRLQNLGEIDVYHFNTEWLWRVLGMVYMLLGDLIELQEIAPSRALVRQ